MDGGLSCMTHKPPHTPTTSDAAGDHPVTDVVETLAEATHRGDTSVGALIGAFGRASFASCLLAVALLLVSPLSGIPFYSTASGMVIALIAAQAAFGRSAIWLPAKIWECEVSGQAAARVEVVARRMGEVLDRASRRRLPFLVNATGRRVIYGLCALCGAIIPFFEILPMTSSLMGGAVALMAAAILARDGLLVVLGWVMIGVALAIPAVAILMVIEA